MNINTKDLKDFMMLQELELKFRLGLYEIQEMSKIRYDKVLELKKISKPLRALKDKFNSSRTNSDIDKYIIQLLDNKFNSLGVDLK